MGLFFDDMNNFELSPHDSPLSKRRRFTSDNQLLNFIASDACLVDDEYEYESPVLQELSAGGPLPEQIQADLLKVGMRVRKAVPEGYKTRKFTPRPFFNTGRLSPETLAAISGTPKPAEAEASPFDAGGLHKVGALAMQPVATATFCGINLAAMSDMETRWSRPESFSEQKMWSYSTSHKRNLELDEDSAEDDWTPATPTLTGDAATAMPVDYFNIDMENMVDISPFTQVQHKRQDSYPFKPTSMPELNVMGGNARKVVKPKSRMRTVGNTLPPSTTMNTFNPFTNLTMIPEQMPAAPVSSHARSMSSCAMELNFHDFGESPFLQRREDVDMDCS